MGFYSRVFLVFLMKESKKRRRKQPGKLMAKSHSQPGKLMAKSHSQPVNLPSARPLMNPCTCIEIIGPSALHNAQNFIYVQRNFFSKKLGKFNVPVSLSSLCSAISIVLSLAVPFSPSRYLRRM